MQAPQGQKSGLHKEQVLIGTPDLGAAYPESKLINVTNAITCITSGAKKFSCNSCI
jgi:hypothetical protein